MLNDELRKAKELLLNSSYTCVITKDDMIYTSTERGVKPLLQWLEDKTDLRGAFVADKAVGKAAAFLHVLLQVKAVYAPVMSRYAISVLQDHGIEAFFDEETDFIRNRAGTGQCPMEQTVQNIDDPVAAKKAVIEKLEELSAQTI